MTYPVGDPKMKHDLSSGSQPVPEYPSSLISEMGFSNSAELFRRLDVPLDPAARPHKLGFVYSYSDAPDYPGPLSRSLIVLGVADTSLSLARKVISQEGIPDCLHKCTIAVQLADAKHMQKLEPRHQSNSKIFSKFMKQLRKDEAVAIIAKDKHGRFAIVAPMGEPGPSDSDPSTIAAEDCAAFCYVGDAKEVMEFLATSAARGVETNTQSSSSETLWQPPGAESSSSDPVTCLWQPPGASDDAVEAPAFSAPWESSANNESTLTPAWDAPPVGGDNTMAWGTSGEKRSFDEMNGGNDDGDNDVDNDNGESIFHTDSGAAAADAFYSGLTRSLDTRADSYLYHMRAFNGWVKATQIQELDPIVTIRGKSQGRTQLRVLDLACGKGGDLNKWSLHSRGIKGYVGIDVARGSLKDAAIRAREMRKKNKLSRAIFTVADLGADVPGRKKSANHKQMQKLLTWSLEDEAEHESTPPDFQMKRGGGISENDRFDVVSIQFAIHYMMSTRKRARRFFHTVSELLEVGGNLICTTIDARVVIDHLMNLGHNYHFHSDEEPDFSEAVVEAGAGVCKIRFKPEIVKTIVTSGSDGSKAEDDLFGLQYTFTLVEGSDHAAGVGDAVNLPEWLTPLPVLEALAQEAGLELEYAQNFHEFYEARKDPSANPAAHLALYNMKVLNRDGSISSDEWSVSRLYAAIRFRKVRESTMKVEDEIEEENMESDEEPPKEESEVELDPIKAKKMLPMAMIQAKRSAGEEVWNTLSSEEKKRLTEVQLQVLARK
jgi:SAM-dependent methyltransferase